MFDNNDFYTPDQVDQQVDRLLYRQDMPERDQRLVFDLHDRLENGDEDYRSLQRVLTKLRATGHNASQQKSEITPISPMPNSQQELSGIMHHSVAQFSRSSKPVVRLFSTLAAVLVVALLNGSMLFAINAEHQQNGAPGGSESPKPPTTAIHTPTPSVKEGQIVYQSKQFDLSMPVVWSPNAKRVATAVDRTTVESWDALTGKNVLNYRITTGNSGAVANVAWSPDGRVLAVAESNTIYLFNASNTQLIRTFTPPAPTSNKSSASPLATTASTRQPVLFSSTVPLSGGNNFGNVTWSPNGQYIAAVYNGPWHGTFSTICIWNAISGSLIKTLSGFSSNSISVSWSSKENLLAVLGYDVNTSSVAKVWDTTSWNIIKQYPNTFAFDWSPDGTKLALAATDNMGGIGNSVRIVDALSGQTVKQLSTLAGPIHWSPDGTRLAVEERGTRITIWSVASGQRLYSFLQDESSYNAVWSPDSRYISSVQNVRTKHSDGKFYDAVEILIWAA